MNVYSSTDEKEIVCHCERLEAFVQGGVTRNEALAIVHKLEQQYQFLGEKTHRLRVLLAKSRVDDLNEWRSDLYGNISAIRNLAHAHNIIVVARIEHEKRFRVEMSDPSDIDHSPLVFLARVYINDEYNASIRCIVNEADISTFRISNRSLSKYRTRRRRIEEYANSIRQHFAKRIENQWLAGVDITSMTTVTFAQTNL